MKSRWVKVILLFWVLSSIVAGYFTLRTSVEQSEQAIGHSTVALAKTLARYSEALAGSQKARASDLVRDWNVELKPFREAELFVVGKDGRVLSSSVPGFLSQPMPWHFRVGETISANYFRTRQDRDYLVSRAFSQKNDFFVFIYFADESLRWRQTAKLFPWIFLMTLSSGLLLPVALYLLSNKTNRRKIEELRGLARKLQSQRETELLELSRNLHDDLGQVLAMLKLETTKARPKRERLVELADEATGRVKDALNDLRPALLELSGLVAALTWQARKLEAQSGIAIGIVVAGKEVRMDRKFETAAYRTCQELLTNAIKHARARMIRIELEFVRELLAITVSDDGEGFEPEEQRMGFGLLGVTERVEGLGGKLELTSSPFGTVARVTLPIVRRDDSPGHNE